MKAIVKNRKLIKIIVAVLISAFAGGLTKKVLFPDATTNQSTTHAKPQQSSSQIKNIKNQSMLSTIRQYCPDCESQIKILNKIMQEHPEAIDTFKRHFNKLTQKDLQGLINNWDAKMEMSSVKTSSSATNASGQDDLSKYTDLIKDNISNINFSDIKRKFNELSS